MRRALLERPGWAKLIEAVPAAFYLDRVDGTSVYVSPQIEGVIGCTAAEWASGYGRWLEYIHPDDRDRVAEATEEFLRTGSQGTDEYRVVMPDGSVRWIHEQSVLLTDEETGEQLVHGVVVDVTSERATQEVAERVARLFRALVEHSHEAVTIVDENGVITYENPSMGRVIGRPPQWLVGRSPLELMPPEDADRARAILAELLRTPGAQLPGEFRLRHADGSWRVVVGLATNLFHEPEVRGILLNYRDVTEERAVGERLAAADARRRELLESMVHAEDVQRSRIAEELHDDTIQVMTASLLELDRLVSRLRRDDREGALTAAASVRRTLAEAAERTRRLTFRLRPQLLEAAGLGRAIEMLVHHTADDLPFDVDVQASVGRYSPVLETLAYRTVAEALANVRKHAHATRVTIRLEERAGHLHGEVVDDGAGFDVQRALEATPAGLHFGLRSTLERVRIAGGTCEVESAPGRGTRLAFALPAERAPLDAAG